MRATVIYNANAGSIKKVPQEELAEALRAQGYEPVVAATDSEEDLERVLAETQGLVIAVGGDGTIRAAALRLIGRDDVEFAFVPAGTANNVAHAFGIDASWQEVVGGLKDGRVVPLDVGRVTGPTGEDYFLEAFGAGLFADTLAGYDPGEGKSILRAIGTLLDVLPGYEPQQWQVSIDGQAVTGNYLLLEVLNTPMTGPHLNLAPDASPSDGLLDVVLIADSERDGLLDYARKMRAGELAELGSVTITRAARVELVWTGFPLHIDAESKVDIEDPDEMKQARVTSDELKPEQDAVLGIQVVPAALSLRLPAVAAAVEESA